MRQITSKTERFSLTIGVTSGYGHANEDSALCSALASTWQDIMEQVGRETGVYVSAVTSPGLVVYDRGRGCPDGGENVVEFRGVRNPDKCDDAELWKNAVIAIATEMKTRLQQVTTQIEFNEAELVYLTDKPAAG